MNHSRLCSPARRAIVFRSFVIALVVAVFGLMTPALAKSQPKPKKPPKLTKTAKFEIDYLKKSIDHHTRIIKKLKNIDTMTTNVQVVAFVKLFVQQEQDEITTMTAWLAQWYSINYVSKVKPSAWDLDDEDEEDQPDDMDILSALIGYDNAEIAWARQIIKKGGHADLKAYAQQVIVTNKAQVQVLKSWILLLDDETDEGEDAA